MLITKTQYTVGDVISIKLVTGEELITRLESETDEVLVVRSPLAITMGAQGVGMIPWVLLADTKKCTISKSHVVAAILTKKEAADQYTQSTSGLTLL